ncbi:prenyltransferase/squalene oxidase repeat-containing protein [Thermococcus sp.]
MGSKLYEIGKYVNANAVIRYIRERRHDDGGYCFVTLLDETNINDTYYAVKIYDLLELEVPEKEKTARFLFNVTGKQTAVVAVAMALEGMVLLGAKDLAGKKLDLLFSKYNPLEGKFAVGLSGSEEFGTSTPLEATYWVLRALKALNYKMDPEMKEKIKEFVMKFKKGEGFGVKQPTTTMTYQAIFSLNALGCGVPKTRHFDACEVYGGFTEVPYSLPPYLEPTFYAIRGLRLLGDRPRYIKSHISFIKALQNPNGGFRRSLEMGISNFQNTYRALRALDDLLAFYGG